MDKAQQRRHQQHATIAVLNVGRMHDRLHQQAVRVAQDVPFLASDLFTPIKARRIDPTPPFSALLTLWLSMIAAVGLASRPAVSRHWT